MELTKIITELLQKANPNIVIFLLTSLSAFIVWIIKKLFETPLNDSKETFNKILTKRVDILTKIKIRLNLLAYMPDNAYRETVKKELQKLLLEDASCAYLNKIELDSIILIAIEDKVDEEKVMGLIKIIDADLGGEIKKVYDEVAFYKKYSSLNPFKRIFKLSILFIKYIAIISSVSLFLFLLVKHTYVIGIYILLPSVLIGILVKIWLYYKKWKKVTKNG